MIKKILHSTVAKIIIGMVVIIVVYALSLLLLNDIFRAYKEIQVVRLIAIPIIATALVLVSYSVLYHYYEKRKITELSTRNIGKYIGFGLLLGLFLPALSILLPYLRGEYVVLSISDVTNVFLRDLTISVLFGIATAVFEEVLFRGVLFRLIEDKLGSYIAIIISGIIFGFVHLMNANSSLLAAIAISIEAGMLISAAYMLTRNLWFPIAIHFAWNFTEGDIFGTSVSGTDRAVSIIVSKLEGSQWFTGGAWGIEAAIQTVIIGAIAGIILLVLSHRKGEILKPYWKRL
jgi:membrane protease YdiL (CAAX protease family)